MCSCQREKLGQDGGDGGRSLKVGCVVKQFLQMTTSVKIAINFLPVPLGTFCHYEGGSVGRKIICI